MPRNSKYGAVPTVVDNIRFASKKEAKRYEELKLLSTGVKPYVMGLQLQPEWDLVVNGVLICKYRADFTYVLFGGYEWSVIVEDVKGIRTPAYKLKKKLMKAIHGIEIQEV
jgi:hypothetical protein